MTEAVAVGYPAGSALGLQAVALANAWLGQPDAAWDRVADLRRLVSDLGTYRHLLAAPFWLLGDDAEFFAIAGQCEWMIRIPFRTLVTQAVGALAQEGDTVMTVFGKRGIPPRSITAASTSSQGSLFRSKTESHSDSHAFVRSRTDLSSVSLGPLR